MNKDKVLRERITNILREVVQSLGPGGFRAFYSYAEVADKIMDIIPNSKPPLSQETIEVIREAFHNYLNTEERYRTTKSLQQAQQEFNAAYGEGKE